MSPSGCQHINSNYYKILIESARNFCNNLEPSSTKDQLRVTMLQAKATDGAGEVQVLLKQEEGYYLSSSKLLQQEEEDDGDYHSDIIGEDVNTNIILGTLNDPLHQTINRQASSHFWSIYFT